MKSIKGFKQGRANGAAVLTEAQVRVIRQKSVEEGMSAPQLARIYRVSAETIRRILRGETWNWLDDEPRAIQQRVEDTPLPESTPETRAAAAASFARLQAKLAGGAQAPSDSMQEFMRKQAEQDEKNALEAEGKIAARIEQETKHNLKPAQELNKFLEKD